MSQKGNALITLLIFVAVGITITTGAIIVSVINTQGTSKISQSEIALATAESGAENAVLRVLRDYDYTGETLNVGSGTATIVVSGGSNKTIVSEGQYNSFKRKIQVDVTITNDQLQITDWKEIN